MARSRPQPHVAFLYDPESPNSKESTMSDPIVPPVPGTEHGVYSDPAKVSPKVIAATVLALLVPGILAVITYVGANQDVLGINSPVLGVLISAIIPGLLTFVAGYAAKDPARNG